MPTYELPPALVRMASERRLIPFVGAGFSAAVGLPGWRDMLRSACDVLEDGPDFDTIERSCGGNLLQAAEYLFIASGNHIGPLRQRIGDVFQTSSVNVVRSGAHVELVNLGAPLVYTTNYDDLIERTHRELGQQCDVIALPRHLALGSGLDKPQVVKYHGDLRYEDTLVLTERSYYRRLDFESPMDLKFRSDLLGRSVLFLGYSFNDVNIRVVWHKLMQMMQDVPEQDRPVSWILRFEEDPIQEALNLAAGIRTIVLHPLDEPGGDNYSLRLQAFLLDLNLAAVSDARTGWVPHKQMPRQFVSSFVARPLPSPAGDSSQKRRVRRNASAVVSPAILRALATREIPEELAPDVDDLIGGLARTFSAAQFQSVTRAALNAIRCDRFGPGISFAILRSLGRAATRRLVQEARELSVLSNGDFPWREIYKQPQPLDALESLTKLLVAELGNHGEDDFVSPDTDILFALDTVLRLLNGEVAAQAPVPPSLREEAERAVARARDLYTVLAAYEPVQGQGPDFAQEQKLEEELPSIDVDGNSIVWSDEPPF